MPLFVPVHPPRNPDECPSWLFEALERLNRSQADVKQNFGAILRGEAPDGSGSSLIDLTKFFYKPGLTGGQVGYGGINANENLTFGSTFSATKGSIFFGTGTNRAAFDEDNAFFGIGTDTPSVRLHLKPDANSRYLMMEPTTFSVSCTISNGSAVVTGGSFAPSGGPRVVPGMLITGTGIPAGTYVKTLDSGSQLTMTQNATGNGSSATFQSYVRFEDKNDETGGKEVQFRSFGGIRFTPGPPDASGFEVPFRILGDPSAIASGVTASPRIYLEVGYINLGVATGTDLQIGGPGHGELAHLNIWSRTMWFSRSPSSGTNPNFSMGSLNPAEFGVVAAGFGPSSTLMLNLGANTGSALTMFGDGSSATILDIFSGTAGGVVAGSSPNKTIDRTLYIVRVTSNGRFWLGSVGSAAYQTAGSNDLWSLWQGSNDLQKMQAGRIAGWSDTLVLANSFYLALGDVSSTHRAMFISSRDQNVFTRFGVSTQYFLISNGVPTGAQFPSPDGAGSPTLLRLYNAATGGFDASVLLKLESARVGQAGDFLQVILQSAAVPFKLQSTGKMVTTVAPQIDTAAATTGDVWTATDNDGNGDWAAPSGGGGSGKPQYVWKANGPFLVGTSVDGGIVAPTAFTIGAVWLHRTTPGTSGSTIIDLNINGVTAYTTQGNRPTIAFNDVDNKVQATNPDVTSVVAGDVLTIDIDQIEGGVPQDAVLIIEST